MIEKNFFLTDLMKTGDHQTIEQFLSIANISKETIEYTGEFYTLHNFNLKEYKHCFAIIDHCAVNARLWKNKEYWDDFIRRISLLKENNFKFILSHPWESEENMQNQQYYKEYLRDTKNYTWSGGTSWFWFLMHRKHQDKKYNFNHDNKKYDFLYLNKQSRTHRKKLFDALRKKSLLDNSLISFLDPPYNIKLDQAYELPWLDTSNYPRHNSSNYPRRDSSNYPRYGSDQDIYEAPYNDCAFNIVSETNDNNNDVFITEKLWKPIIAQQIFVVHGNYGYLKKLREMGFRTFDSVFDESYDEEPDPDRRIEKIVSLCQNLRTMDKSKIYLETESIRKHNRDRFYDTMSLSDAVNKTVSGFLEFADRG